MSARNSQRRAVCVPDLVEELSIGAAIRLRCKSDDIRDVVQALVAYISEEYRTQDFYVPAPARELPNDEIRAAVASGESVRSICRRYHISRRMVYRVMSGERDA